MLTKGIALKVLESVDNHGARKPCHILFVTADREAWKKKQRLMRRLAALAALDRDTSEFKKLQAEIDSLDVGGRPVQHDNVVLSGPRGIHSKRAKEMKSKAPDSQRNPNHWENRTRNLVFLPSGAVRKMHNSLLFQINHQKVLY